MDDLISRQAAIDAVQHAFDRETLLNSFVRKVAVDALKTMPSAQPEQRKKGKWQITEAYPHNVHCSDADYIEREAAIDAVDKRIEELRTHEAFNRKTLGEIIDLSGVKTYLLALPAADVKPVVLCKNCKHRDPEDGMCDCRHPIVWQFARKDDWFCADGELRGNDNECID